MQWMLVHGTLRGVGHAWLEYEDTVYDSVLDRYYQKAVYYSHMQAIVDRRYTREEAAKELLRVRLWGLWHTYPAQRNPDAEPR